MSSSLITQTHQSLQGNTWFRTENKLYPYFMDTVVSEEIKEYGFYPT